MMASTMAPPRPAAPKASGQTRATAQRPTAEAARRVGRYTIHLGQPVPVVGAAAVGGPMEGAGPLGKQLDHVYPDRLLGQRTWEQAESRMLYDAVVRCCEKTGIALADVDLLYAGDLLNQIISSSFAARDLDIPYIGLFGACSTFTLGLGLAAMAVDGGYARRAIAAVSSHHDTAERQYRFPTEFGGQRPLTAQWTATGAAAVLVGEPGQTGASGVAITHITFGRVIDTGLKDPFDMGSCMAAAAADTIQRHFEDTGRSFSDYDQVATGDLARVGHPVATEVLLKAGYDPGDRFTDCGILLYDPNKQDVHAGGSGCACSGIVFITYFLPQLSDGRLRRLLLVATGCLHSKTSYQQRESIPTVAHAIAFEQVGEST